MFPWDLFFIEEKGMFLLYHSVHFHQRRNEEVLYFLGLLRYKKKTKENHRSLYFYAVQQCSNSSQTLVNGGESGFSDIFE